MIAPRYATECALTSPAESAREWTTGGGAGPAVSDEVPPLTTDRLRRPQAWRRIPLSGARGVTPRSTVVTDSLEKTNDRYECVATFVLDVV